MDGNGKTPQIGEPPIPPDQMWRITNPIMQKFEELREAFQHLEENKFRFLIITGPPGINKSGEAILFLQHIYRKTHAEWLALPEDMRPPRRTEWDALGNCYFKEPFVFRGGQIEAPAFYHYLYLTCEPDEYFVLDDMFSLGVKQNREMLHQIADAKRGGEVTRETNATRKAAKKGEIELTIRHKGKVVLITNDTRDGKEAKLKFSEALQDRARWVEFDWEPEPLIEYLDNMAFGTDPHQGLYKYLLGSNSPNLDEDDRGLAFQGTEDEAFEMLRDVRTMFIQNAHRMRVLGFRSMRRFLYHRRWTPDHWRVRCEPEFKKR
jgi:hypothetical protein